MGQVQRRARSSESMTSRSRTAISMDTYGVQRNSPVVTDHSGNASEGVVGKVHQIGVDVFDDGAGRRDCRQDSLGEERGRGELAAVEGIIGTGIECGTSDVGLHEQSPPDE